MAKFPPSKRWMRSAAACSEGAKVRRREGAKARSEGRPPGSLEGGEDSSDGCDIHLLLAPFGNSRVSDRIPRKYPQGMDSPGFKVVRKGVRNHSQ